MLISKTGMAESYLNFNHIPYSQSNDYNELFGLHVGYVSLYPVSKMRKSLNSPSNGFHIGLDYKFSNTRFAAGMDLGFTFYGQKTEPIAFRFDESSPITETNININNNLLYFLFGGDVKLYKTNRTFNPYLMFHGGLVTAATKLKIDNPEHDYDCYPLVYEIVNNDATIGAKTGLGMRINLTGRKSKLKNEGLFIDFNLSYLRGGNLSYMVHSGEGRPSNRNSHQTASHSGSRIHSENVDAEFLNLPTGEIHHHKVGELHRNQLTAINFLVRFVIRL